MALILLDQAPGPRLLYILDFIFNEGLGLSYEWTLSRDTYLKWEGVKLAYLYQPNHALGLVIKRNDFIDQKAVKLPQNLSIHRWKKTIIFFYNQPGKKIPFDLFSATFLLLSRMEEYNSQDLDAHQRFKPEKSLAYQYGFLEEPIIDIWIAALRQLLVQTFNVKIPLRKADFQITVDIDYLSKYGALSKIQYCSRVVYYSLKRNKEALKLMKAVRQRNAMDPYEKIWQEIIHSDDPILCFILLSQGHKFDTNHKFEQFDYTKWIKKHKNHLDLNIHPSYRGHEQPEEWEWELQFLENQLQKKVEKSRFHYIKFSLPDSYHQLIKMNIKEDYSMGYGSINGYRASTSRSFLWYDLSKEATSVLRIYPFAFMDSTAYFHTQKSMDEHWNYLHKQFQWAQLHGTTLTAVFHNYLLADQVEYLELFKKSRATFKV